MADTPKAYDVHGKRILQTETGKFISADDALASDLLSNGLDGQTVTAVSPEQWIAERQRREADTLAGQAETFGRGAAEAVGNIAQVGAKIAGYTPGTALTNYLAQPAWNAIKEATGFDPKDLGRGLPGQVAGILGGPESEQAYIERTKLLHEVNPTSYGAGELAANVGVGLLTGGATMAGGKAIAGGLARAGLGQVASGALGTGAAMALEGGFYGAAQTEGQAREAGQTEGATAEQLVQGIGLSALLGGGMGLGFGAAGSAFRKLVSKADQVIPPGIPGAATEAEATAKAAFSGESRASEDAVARLQSKLTGADYETLQRYGAHNFSDEAVEGRNLWKNRTKTIEAAVPKMVDSLEQLDNAIEDITVNVKKVALKREGVQSMFEGVDEVAAKRTGMDRLRATMTSANEVLDSIPKDDPALDGIRKRLGRYVHFINNHLDGLKTEGQNAADVYVVSDLVKREAQKVEKALATTYQRSQDGSVVEAAGIAKNAFEHDVHEPLRVSLEDVDTWGRAGEAQREINARWKPFIEENSRYNREITTTDNNSVWGDGRTKYFPDSAKVQGWIEGIGTSRGQTAQEAVRERIRAAKDLVDTISKYHPLDSAQIDQLGNAERAYKSVQSELSRLDKTMSIANKIEDVIRAEKDAATLTSPIGTGMVGRTIGAVTGAIQAGPMGSLLGAAGLLAKPGSAMAAADQVSSMANRLGVKMTGKAGNWVRTAGEAGQPSRLSKVVEKAAPVAKVAQKVAVPTAVSLFVGKDKDLESAYERRTNQLIRAQQDPDSVIENTARVTGGLATVNPSLAGALVGKTQVAISFLAAKAPAGTLDPTALMPGRKSVVPKLEMTRFARVWAAVERPMTVLEDLQRGQATPDQIEALRVVHPETYQAIRATVMDAILEVARKGGRIPIATRQQLDLLLDLGGAGEPAFAPEISDRISKLQAQAMKLKAPQAPRGHKVPNLMASARLPQDSWPSAKG
jgi:hypothetical protein